MKKIVNLYIVDVSKFSLEELLLNIKLNQSEKEYIASFIQTNKKKEQLISLYLKKQYIGEYFYNEFNKPISNNIHFNISHSNNLVALVTSDVDVGIDVEFIKKASDKLKRYISSDDEINYIKDDYSFYELWTSKEALSKCIGTGIIDKPNKIKGLPINGIKIINNNEYNSKVFKYLDYVICITLKTNLDFDVKINEVDKIL